MSGLQRLAVRLCKIYVVRSTVHKIITMVSILKEEKIAEFYFRGEDKITKKNVLNLSGVFWLYVFL